MMRRTRHVALLAAWFAACFALTPQTALSQDPFGSSPIPPPADSGNPPPPPPPPPSPQRCQATIDEVGGVVTITIRDPARAGQRFDYRVDDLPYVTHFDRSGTVTARAPIFHQTVAVGWDTPGGHCPRSVSYRDFGLMLVTALIWSGPYELALRVTEPGGESLGSAGAPPPGSALGSIQSFGEPGDGTGTQVLLYAMPRSRAPASGVIYFAVEFLSRGNPAHPPYCGAGTAAVTFRLLNLDAQRLESQNLAFGPQPCGFRWNPPEDRFIRLQRKL